MCGLHCFFFRTGRFLPLLLWKSYLFQKSYPAPRPGFLSPVLCNCWLTVGHACTTTTDIDGTGTSLPSTVKCCLLSSSIMLTSKRFVPVTFSRSIPFSTAKARSGHCEPPALDQTIPFWAFLGSSLFFRTTPAEMKRYVKSQRWMKLSIGGQGSDKTLLRQTSHWSGDIWKISMNFVAIG